MKLQPLPHPSKYHDAEQRTFPPSSYWTDDPESDLKEWNQKSHFYYVGPYVGAALLRWGPRCLPGIVVHGADAMIHLTDYESAELVPYMANAFHRLKKARPDAETWFRRFPEAGAVGLIPRALGAPGKDREAATSALLWLHSQEPEVVRKTAGRYGVTEVLASLLEADPLITFLPATMPPLPSFWTPVAFARPALQQKTHVLSLAAVQHLGTMLAISTLDRPYPGLEQVRQACDPASLADFAWDLYQAWEQNGSPPKESWAFAALGFLGDDRTVRKLVPLIRAWPGESLHARATAGLDVLCLIGTDLALMQLNGIAQKLKFKGLQERAQDKMRELAENRGLTRAELEDRLVPDFDLDEGGSLTLDYGPRQFRVDFNEYLQPVLRDADGKTLKELPKPAKTDDTDKAAPAVEKFKLLKKDVKAVADIQLNRLEQAMLQQRVWTADAFLTLLVGHPLLINLARRLLWQADEQTFRVAEDGTLADHNDELFVLPGEALVRIPHPIRLTAALRASWSQIFSDYHILQPFLQLARPTHALPPRLDRVRDVKVPFGKVLGLEKRGWERGAPQDAGIVHEMEKGVFRLPISPGLWTGAMAQSPEQTLGIVQVLGKFSDIEYSEMIGDLDTLT